MGGVIGGTVEMSPGGYENLTRSVPGCGHCMCFEHTWTYVSRRPGREPELQRGVGWVLKTAHLVIANGKKTSTESTSHVSLVLKYGAGVLFSWSFNCLLNAKPFEHRKPAS